MKQRMEKLRLRLMVLFAAGMLAAVPAVPALPVQAKEAGKTVSRQAERSEGAKYLKLTGAYAALNELRGRAGRRPLKKDPALVRIARVRARELSVSFSHIRPNGSRGLLMIPGNIYKGENLAKGQTSFPAALAAWKASASHRANMENPHYKKVGMAAYRAHGRTYWVQIFSS